MRVTHRDLLIVVAVCAAAALAGMALLWPSGDRDLVAGPPPDAAQHSELVDATLVEVTELPAGETIGMFPQATMVTMTARLAATGELVTFEMADETGETFRAGQRVRLLRIEQPDQEPTYYVSDFRRERPLLLLGALFVFAVIGFGRFQGARALFGLLLTFLVIIGFMIPAILDGRSPVAVALVGAMAIMIVTLYLSHGFSAKTSAAVVGTAGALLLTGALAVIFVSAASLTGFTSEEARLANLEVGGLSLQGLLLAGIIIGGLGVLDDVTMSQASTVFELRRANPSAGFGALFTGALNVGRDHIAATVNTLFLAYAGAALPLLILFVTGTDSIGTILTAEIVAVEVVRTLVGSLGLIAAVPVTSALAAAVALPPATVAAAAASREPGGRQAGAVPDEGDDTAAAEPTRSTLSAAMEAEPEDPEWEARLRAAYGLRERPPADEGPA